MRGLGTVELLGLRDNVVETGVLQDNIKCRMELNAVKLCPFEVAIQVVQVLDESVWTREIVEEWLGQCVGFVIRWKRADVRSVSGGTSSIAEFGAGQNFSFPSPARSDFEFEHEVCLHVQVTGTQVTHPIVRKVPSQHEACPQ